MKIPDHARYDYCNQRACDFLEQYKIKSFPIDVEKIISDNGWGLTRYSELMNEFSCDLEKVIQCLRSKDGYTQLDNDNYSIAYNDSDQLGNRKRFTLMHEIGHIYLNHLIDFEATRLYRGSLTKEENKVLENEANAFARNVLVPTAMLEHLKVKNTYNISQQFGITEKAARTRLNLYLEDLKLNKSNGTIPRLYKIFYNFYYKKKCTTCGYSIIAKSIKYCPICGKKTLQWGDGEMQYKIKYDLNERKQLYQCSVCENENIPDDAIYCQICGAPVQNKCILCGELADANARYCIYCGSETTFNLKILPNWKDELEEIKKQNSISEGFLNIPDEYEEGLPFN